MIDFRLELATAIQACDGMIYVVGNGGSCADAMHFAGEFRKHCVMHLMDASTITAIANDVNYESIFSNQIEGKCDSEDILVCLSTSGKSKNIINAVMAASNIGMKVFCLLGKGGGDLKDSPAIKYIVDSDETPAIQEIHKVLLHDVWKMVEG